MWNMSDLHLIWLYQRSWCPTLRKTRTSAWHIVNIMVDDDDLAQGVSSQGAHLIHPESRIFRTRHKDWSAAPHYSDVIMGAMTSQITNHDCLLNLIFRRRSKKTSSELRVTGLCEGNSPVTGEFPAQMVDNAENVSIRWRHHDLYFRSQSLLTPYPCHHQIISDNIWERQRLSSIQCAKV